MPTGEQEDLENHRMTLSYDGQGFAGWQRHGDDPTIQLEIERAITATLGIRVPVRGSGRTDRGAHARGQVASVLLPRGLDVEATRRGLNDALAPAIEIHALEIAGADFHACDSAIGKRYRYVIWNRARLPAAFEGRVWHVPELLDFDAMRGAVSVLVGEHDFASFAKRPNFKQRSTCRHVTHAGWRRGNDDHELIFEICADGFLYKMVRNLVRALVKVGEGRYGSNELRRILASRDRKAAPGTAPASGLYLDRVFYPGDVVDLGQPDVIDGHLRASKT